MAQPVPLRGRVEVSVPARFRVGQEKELARDARPAVVKVTDQGFDLLEVVRVIDLGFGLPEVAKVIDQGFGLPAAVKATDLEYDHLEVVKVIDQDVLLDNVPQAGDLRAIGHQDGGLPHIVRPSPARPTGTRGIDRAIVRRVIGGDRLRQQP